MTDEPLVTTTTTVAAAPPIGAPGMVTVSKPTTKAEWTLICLLASILAESAALSIWLTLTRFPDSQLHDVIHYVGIALWISLGVQAVGLLIFMSSNTGQEIRVGVPGGGNLEIGHGAKGDGQ